MAKWKRIELEKKEKPKLKISCRTEDGKRKSNKIYRNGAEGFIQWVEDFEVSVEIFVDGVPAYRPMVHLSKEPNPETGRSPYDMWDEFKRIARECLVLQENGRLKYKLIVLCWMRGEGKSAFVCLIQLWKFFVFPSQKIMLGANSKDQSKFVHFDIMRDIILNSPRLLAIIGERNIQEKQISMKNTRNKVVSFVRSISSFSGIVSNISGYTFSEIFDMKKPKFFTQLDGSIRNIPNALGCIDSTVSTKDHILYNLYTLFRKGTDPTIYFSHRQSKDANSKDYWNPEMTQQQLDSYRGKFPIGEFNQYFRNTWESASTTYFNKANIMATLYAGYNGVLGEQSKVVQIMQNCITIEDNENLTPEQRFDLTKAQMEPLIPVSSIYTLSTEYYQPRGITMDELKTLSDLYDTNWCVQAGVDRADPEKKDLARGARTIAGVVLKGLPGSRSSSYVFDYNAEASKYIYFLAHVEHLVHSDIDSIKMFLERVHDEYNGIDSLCSERWGMWDMGNWCETNNIVFEPIAPTYDRQREGFSEVFTLISQGRYKAPELVVRGSKKDNIFLEEAENFEHNAKDKFFGSSTKNAYNGVQDDFMYMLCWSIYGGRMLTSNDFRIRERSEIFGIFTPNKELIGEY